MRDSSKRLRITLPPRSAFCFAPIPQLPGSGSLVCLPRVPFLAYPPDLLSTKPDLKPPFSPLPACAQPLLPGYPPLRSSSPESPRFFPSVLGRLPGLLVFAPKVPSVFSLTAGFTKTFPFVWFSTFFLSMQNDLCDSFDPPPLTFGRFVPSIHFFVDPK